MTLLKCSIFVYTVLGHVAAFAQAPSVVPLEQEPHHKIVFENPDVRIYHAVIAPGESTLYHPHVLDGVAVTLEGGKSIAQLLDKAPQEGLRTTGAAGFNKSPYTHRVENVGTSQLYFIGVELKGVLRRVGTVSDFASNPGHQLVLENERVKVYRISLEPSQSTGMRSRAFPWTTVALTNASLSVERGPSTATVELKRGDHQWHEGSSTESLKNVGSTRFEDIEIELK